MNRIVLIGNGFDLAHRLPTRYRDFIKWYWEQVIYQLQTKDIHTFKNEVCSLTCKKFSTWDLYFEYQNMTDGRVDGLEFLSYILYSHDFNHQPLTPFFERICKGAESKNWAGIEEDYYRTLKQLTLDDSLSSDQLHIEVEKLNKQLSHIQNELVKYLSSLDTSAKSCLDSIKKHVYESIQKEDIYVSSKNLYDEQIQYWLHADATKFEEKLDNSNVPTSYRYGLRAANKAARDGNIQEMEDRLCESDKDIFTRPDSIMLLSFNYTSVADKYISESDYCRCRHIHGTLKEEQSIIFGYGDELDDDYKKILNKNDNTLLAKAKSIRYLESSTYREILQFIESAPYQVYIMGHSCGNSDRTLLNTLFEHENCISIKPFFYETSKSNNYLDIVQNIYRNFTDMKLMRNKVVNKSLCKSLDA